MDSTLNTLNRSKDGFLLSVQRDIDAYIVKQKSHCIDIVERDNSTEKLLRTHRASLDPDFAEVLYKFVRQKPYNGHKLDSALTDPICDIVCKKYQTFYEDNAKIVSQGVLEALTSNNLVLKSLINKLADKVLDKSASHIRGQVVQHIVHQIHNSVAAGTLHTVGHQVSTAAVHVASTTVGALVIQLIAKLLAAHIGTIIAKIMASALVKKVVALVAKKCVFGVVVSFLAAHVGAAAGGVSVAWIVLPALVVYLGYKITTFPEKLGEKVSQSVKQELSDRFYGMNKDILDRILDEVVNGDKLLDALADNDELKKMMKDMASSL
jgi:hypothetical protein